MVSQVNRPRVETPERWAKALERAASNGLDLFEVAGMSSTYAVTSSRDAGLVYLSTPTDCGCEAALSGDAVCQHRAAVRAALGLLAPVPADDAQPAAVDCPACHGRGWVYCGDDYHWPDKVACRRCDGSGEVAVWIRTAVPATALAAD